MPRFFHDDDGALVGTHAEPARYSAPRPIQGSAERLQVKTRTGDRAKEPVAEWQEAAWRFFDSIGEVHFAFSLIAQIISRVRLYAAVVVDPEEQPVSADDWVDRMEEVSQPDVMRERVDACAGLLLELTNNTPGRGSGLMRTMALNLLVPGEVYLAQIGDQWLPLSGSELTQSGTGGNSTWRVQRSRRAGRLGYDEVPGSAFVARIWRSHPRYGKEPDSSMLGVLDSCEAVTLYDKALRAMSRRAMNAGVVYVPNGITAYNQNAEDSIADVLARSALQSATDEAAIETVTPKVLTGPPELGDKLKFIPLTEPFDPNMAQAADRALERVMQGIDIPKDIVKGLADTKFANAIVIDDALYRAHIEPLLLLLVDSLTTVYLQPRLKAAFPQQDVSRFVVWYDPSAIVTRPDKSQAADVGYGQHLLSGSAWRRARGFTELDAPDTEETLRRLAIEKASLPPDMAAALIESLAPEFFAKARAAGQEQAGFPDDLSSLLSGTSMPAPADPTATSPTTPPAAAEQMLEGVTPGGQMPPRPG